MTRGLTAEWSFRRSWIARLLLAVLSPVVFFLLLEGVAGFAGVEPRSESKLYMMSARIRRCQFGYRPVSVSPSWLAPTHRSIRRMMG